MRKKLILTDLGRMDEKAFKEAPKLPFRIVLDNIRSGNNIGSVFRTADAFRCDQLILGGITACPPQRDITKTAIGAENSMDWEYHEDLVVHLCNLKEEGWKIAAVEQVSNSVALQDWKPSSEEKWCVILGNEVKGVAQELVDLADVVLELPQFGTKHSLNVSVCTGIVVWEYMRCSGLSALDV